MLPKTDDKKIETPAARPPVGGDQEQELEALAQQSDDLTDQVQGQFLTGQYSPETVKLLVAALNKVLPLFDQEPVGATEIGPEVVSALQMVARAAEDAGLESFDLLAEDDAGLELVIGVLEQLATSPEFKRFLRSRAPEAAAPEPPPAAPPKGAPPAGEEDLDSLFAGRMGV